MKPKLAPRHIIPVVCYALLLIGFALLAVFAFTFHFAGLDEVELDPWDPAKFFWGMSTLGYAMIVKLTLIVVSIGSAVLALLALVFSSINVQKRGRKLAVACLAFDIRWCYAFLGSMHTLLSAFETLAPFVIALTCLAVFILALIMNILNIKNNVPAPEIAAEAEHS